VLADDGALAHLDPRALRVEDRARHDARPAADGDSPDQLGARREIGGRMDGWDMAAVADEHAP
jgi:hypothetical protein